MARPATVDDAVEAIEVIRRSITELCVPDHHDDPVTLDRWLANKKPESFRTWVSNPDNFCVVEEMNGGIMGVGLLHRSGEVRLFYVAPGQVRKGLGRRIHEALETQAALWDLQELHLESTAVARCFYESLGYRTTGPAKNFFDFLRVYPYAKHVHR